MGAAAPSKPTPAFACKEETKAPPGLIEVFADVGDDPVAVLPKLLEAFEASTLDCFFAVDESLDEDEFIRQLEAVVNKGLSARRSADGLVVSYSGNEHVVRLPATPGARVVVVRALADAMPDLAFKWLVATYERPVLGFCAVPREDWRALETLYPHAAAAHFVDPRTIPVLFDARLGSADLAAPAKQLLVDTLGFPRHDFYNDEATPRGCWPKKLCAKFIFLAHKE